MADPKLPPPSLIPREVPGHGEQAGDPLRMGKCCISACCHPQLSSFQEANLLNQSSLGAPGAFPNWKCIGLNVGQHNGAVPRTMSEPGVRSPSQNLLKSREGFLLAPVASGSSQQMHLSQLQPPQREEGEDEEPKGWQPQRLQENVNMELSGKSCWPPGARGWLPSVQIILIA